MTEDERGAGSRAETRGVDVVVVGSANVDLVVDVPHRPGAGETVLGGDLRTGPGGKGANQAVAAARLGARVAFVGRVGDDEHGRLIRSSLTAAGVDTGRLRTAAAPTGTALILLTPDGENSIVVAPGANALVGGDDVAAAADLLRSTAVLLLQHEIDPDASSAAAGVAASAGARVVLALAPFGPVPDALLRHADPLVVNEHEARQMLDSTAARSGVEASDPAAALLGLGPRSAVVTLGAAGAAAAWPGGGCRVSAPAVVAVDSTGAGDALTGALAWRLAAGDALGDALGLAVRAAAASVARPGAQPSYPVAADLE